MIILVSSIMLILSFRLATLTIAMGDYYRELADNKRLKEIYTTAPRGEIRDRNGRVLAENKLSFTVQISKDELNTLNRKERNQTLLSLTRLLEEDGADYVDDFPIELNTFAYVNEDSSLIHDKSPVETVIDIIISNNLLSEILDSYYIHSDYNQHFKFITVHRAINALKDKGIEVPIIVELNGSKLNMTYDEKENIDNWKAKYKIDQSATPKQALLSLINNDESIIRKIIDHPISRKLTYEIMRSRNLAGNLKLRDFSLSYDDEYLETKKTLMSMFESININTSAKDDFVEIVLQTSIYDLLYKVEEVENNKGVQQIIPGKILIEKIEEKGLESPVEISVDEEGIVSYKYKGKNSSDIPPLDSLINFAKEKGILHDFITSDEIKNLAQKTVLENGYNPKISISKWEYTALVNKANWYEKFKIDENSDAKQAFERLREYYEIDDSLSSYEARGIMSLYDQLDKQGLRAYEPINIAYGIKDSTVAKLAEGSTEMRGVQVSREPIRYYPERETAAHVLGYLGKISQPSEVEKYVKENNYSPNTLIGKTGIEESFELQLKGKDGVQRVEVDSLGNKTKILGEEKPVPGNNIYLTIDLDLQKAAEEALEYGLEQLRKGGTFESKWGNYKFGTSRSKRRPYIYATSGAAVVLSVKTGEVLALANYPAYDPNLFSTGISSSDWESLFPENEQDLLAPRPLYNIAIQSAIQPGSTFKMVTALAALEKGLNPNQRILDMGYVQLGSTRGPACWIWNNNRSTHGWENLYDALMDSCNYYFYSLAFGRNPRTGTPVGVQLDIEDIIDMAKKLGLGEKTGIEINIPSESSGSVPSPQVELMANQNLLRRYLRNNIRQYIKEGLEFTDEEIEEKIEEIVSWTEEGDISRGEVIRRLSEMGFEPEKALPGQRAGLADIVKYDYLNSAGWKITDTLNATIGQGRNAYTPLQMANYIATIANGGYLNKVTLIDSIKSYDNSKTIYQRQVEQQRIDLKDYQNLEHVKIGMRKLVTEGSARSLFANFPVSVAAKTGTAQMDGINPVTKETYDEYAWFVAFAPYEDPEIAVCVVIFQGGSGIYAGPIAREIMAEYFGLNDTPEQEQLPFENGLAR